MSLPSAAPLGVQQKLDILQHAITQLEQDIQSTRARHNAKQEELRSALEQAAALHHPTLMPIAPESAHSAMRLSDSDVPLISSCRPDGMGMTLDDFAAHHSSHNSFTRKTVTFASDAAHAPLGVIACSPALAAAAIRLSENDGCTHTPAATPAVPTSPPRIFSSSSQRRNEEACVTPHNSSQTNHSRCNDGGGSGVADLIGAPMKKKPRAELKLVIDGPIPHHERSLPGRGVRADPSSNHDVRGGSVGHPPPQRKRLMLVFGDSPQKATNMRLSCGGASEALCPSDELSLLDRSSANRSSVSVGPSSAPLRSVRSVVHTHHLQRAPPHNTPLSHRDLNVQSLTLKRCSQAVTALRNWPAGYEPHGSRLLSDVVAARRALARSSIVLAGGDTEVLDAS